VAKVVTMSVMSDRKINCWYLGSVVLHTNPELQSSAKGSKG